MLSIQHLQKHWILERNRYLADLEIDLLSSIALSEGFADHLGECLKRQGSEDRVFQAYTELGLQKLRLVVGCVLTFPVCFRANRDLNATLFVHGSIPPYLLELIVTGPAITGWMRDYPEAFHSVQAGTGHPVVFGIPGMCRAQHEHRFQLIQGGPVGQAVVAALSPVYNGPRR